MVDHSPWPWRLAGNAYTGEFVVLVTSGDKEVASITSEDWDREVREANGMLIAAAPELLRAAKAAINLLETGREDSTPVLYALRAAVAKTSDSHC